MAWEGGGNSQSGYTISEIESMTEDALRRVQQMQDRARSYISTVNNTSGDELYLEAREAEPEVQSNDDSQGDVRVRPQRMRNQRNMSNNSTNNSSEDARNSQPQNDGFYQPRSRPPEFSSALLSEDIDQPEQVVENALTPAETFLESANNIVSLPFLKGIDSDILILGAIIFVLLQEGADKYLIMALGYILM